MADSPLQRCRIIPLPGRQVAFQIDGSERLRWHFESAYPRPFFYPLVGPSGHPLTRMGHPGAPNHDHHRSIWFAHQSVVGNNFWTDQTESRIRQLGWLCYRDADSEAVMAVNLGWFDGHDPHPLLEQELVAAVWPGPEGETFLELQSTFRPTSGRLEFGKTNFGFLGVRVAKSLSAHFGDGRIADSEGRMGEPAIFGRPARWMDYSGSIGRPTAPATEGITYFDHPRNPRYPSAWHVREDGWMIASTCLQEPLLTTRDNPVVLRFLLHTHSGPVTAESADKIAVQFAELGPWRVVPSRAKHTQYEVHRIG